jgi:hypothetical protein
MERYLAASEWIDRDHPAIRAQAAALEGDVLLL